MYLFIYIMSLNLPFDFDEEYDSHTCLYMTNGDRCAVDDSITKKKLSDILSVYNTFKDTPGAAKNYASEDLVKAYKQAFQKMTRFTDTDADSRYKNNYNALFNELEATRNELDGKLESIYNTKGSLGYEYKSHYESTIMSGVLWGTLAVTMIYYVFYKSD